MTKWTVTVQVPYNYTGSVHLRFAQGIQTVNFATRKRLTAATELEWQHANNDNLDMMPRIVAIDNVPWTNFPMHVRSLLSGVWVQVNDECTIEDFQLRVIHA